MSPDLDRVVGLTDKEGLDWAGLELNIKINEDNSKGKRRKVIVIVGNRNGNRLKLNDDDGYFIQLLSIIRHLCLFKYPLKPMVYSSFQC